MANDYDKRSDTTTIAGALRPFKLASEVLLDTETALDLIPVKEHALKDIVALGHVFTSQRHTRHDS